MNKHETKARIIPINLTDEDAVRLMDKAAMVGLTIPELLENFAADLICGRGTNGSDERMFANDWFDRCWFSISPKRSFLSWLISDGTVDSFLEDYDAAEKIREQLAETDSKMDREALQEDYDFHSDEAKGYYSAYCEHRKDPQEYSAAVKEVKEYVKNRNKLLSGETEEQTTAFDLSIAKAKEMADSRNQQRGGTNTQRTVQEQKR